MSDVTSKQCGKCGEVKPLDDFYRDRNKSDGRTTTCKTCTLEARRKHYAENRETVKEGRRQHYAANSAAELQYQRNYHRANPEIGRAQSRRWNAARRKAVFDHYGWTCACCGSADRPSIDHVNGDGREHREQIGLLRGGNSPKVYDWLIKNGFPGGFQTLCVPCNASKSNGGHCRLTHAINPGDDGQGAADGNVTGSAA